MIVRIALATGLILGLALIRFSVTWVGYGVLGGTLLALAALAVVRVLDWSQR